jgi:zinc/manganese transport system substrate-binding protein
VSLVGCGLQATVAGSLHGRVAVVAGENFWGDIAAQIGGRYVAVTSIISNPNTDPHLYETSPQDAAEVSNAQLVIENGLGYDDFIGKVLAASPNPGRRVLSVQRVLHVSGSDPNPHVWYWTARLPEVATAIAAQLSALRPRDRPAFFAAAARFDTSLRPLLAVISQIKAKYAGSPIAYTERVPGYLVQACGLRLATPLGFSLAIENGNDPSPEDTARFDAAITHHHVRVLLYNSQVVDAQTMQIKQLATRAHVPVVGMSETVPPGESFQGWQLRQDRALWRALGG